MDRAMNLLADPEIGDLEDVVDVSAWDLGGNVECWRDLGRKLRGRFVADGIATLPGFLRPSAVGAIAEEFDRARRYVPIVRDRRSVYARDATGLGDHPALSAESDWVAGHITRDMIPAHSPAHRLYVSPRMKSLIAGCVDAEHLYEYADPLAGLIATVLPPGGCYGWHYDTSEYVVTVGIREADAGGRFDYCRNLRTPGDENLDGLAAVMSGAAADAPRSVSSAPGDLQIFAGRYSLHRVTEVSGAADRITLVLAYADRPGVIGPIDRTRRVYGRVTEAHLVASPARPGADGLIL